MTLSLEDKRVIHQIATGERHFTLDLEFQDLLNNAERERPAERDNVVLSNLILDSFLWNERSYKSIDRKCEVEVEIIRYYLAKRDYDAIWSFNNGMLRDLLIKDSYYWDSGWFKHKEWREKIPVIIEKLNCDYEWMWICNHLEIYDIYLNSLCKGNGRDLELVVNTLKALISKRAKFLDQDQISISVRRINKRILKDMSPIVREKLLKYVLEKLDNNGELSVRSLIKEWIKHGFLSGMTINSAQKQILIDRILSLPDQVKMDYYASGLWKELPTNTRAEIFAHYIDTLDEAIASASSNVPVFLKMEGKTPLQKETIIEMKERIRQLKNILC